MLSYYLFPPLIIFLNRNPSVVILRNREDDSTGNLGRHAERCSGKRTKESRVMEDFAHGSTYSAARLRYLLNLWIVRRHRPFSIVEDTELIDILQMFCDHVTVPSARTISRDVQEIFQMTKVNVARFLQVCNTISTSDIQLIRQI